MLLSTLLLVYAFQAPALDELMAKVAENVEKDSPSRRAYVYTQKTYARMLRTNTKLAREERREYLVAPMDDRTDRKLVAFSGQYEKNKQLIAYDSPEFRHKDMDLDGDLLEDLVDDLINDEESRDGIDLDLFPIRKKDLDHYQFTSAGDQEIQGRKAIRVAFRPKKKDWDHIWAGEALIDVEDAFPMQIQTKMNRAIPMAVRTFLGTNMKQLGFSVTFKRLEKDVWFPQSYGTEFRFDLLFGYKRVVAISMETSGFRKASADSAVTFSEVKD